MAVTHEWIDTTTGLEKFLAELKGAERIAIDTEFHRERTYFPQLALVQIAVGNRNVLIDPLAVDLAGLAKVINGGVSGGAVGGVSNDAPLTIMHACEQDLEMLHGACGTIPSRLFDTQIAAGFVGMSQPSLTALVGAFTRHHLSKGDRLANWLHRPLSKSQCQYAASDVAFLFEVTDRLFNDLKRYGRLQWALDECEQARKPPSPPIEPEHVWSRIKNTRHLRGESRAVACTVAAWRERTARAKNIPPRFVLSDLALLAIAQRRPTSAEDTKSLRGLQGQAIGKAGTEAVLKAVRQGLALNPADVPTPKAARSEPPDADLRAAVTLIGAWLDQQARTHRLERSLLASRSDVEQLLAGKTSSRLSHGWREELVGETLIDLLEGRAALAFDRGQGLSAEPRSQPRPDTGIK